MKKRLLIIGGGFAGFWSAISAVRQSREIQKRGEVEITLVNPDNQVTIRQGLNEGVRFELDKYLKPLGVHQIIGRAEDIKPEKNEVVVSIAQGHSILHYDYLILASGGSLKPSNLQGISHTFNLASFDNAEKLEGHIVDLAKKDFLEEGALTFVVVGSEFTGLETVAGIDQKIRTIEAYYSGKKSNFRIVLLESGNQIGSSFSTECRQYIMDVVASKNIEVISDIEITAIGPASILLNNGTCISTRTVIWTKDMIASSLTKSFKGVKDHLNRLVVDQFLKVPGYDNVIAAGNVAHTFGDNRYSSLMDCQYAQFEGRWALKVDRENRPFSFAEISFNRTTRDHVYAGVAFDSSGEVTADWIASDMRFDLATNAINFVAAVTIAHHSEDRQTHPTWGLLRFQRDPSSGVLTTAHGTIVDLGTYVRKIEFLMERISEPEVVAALGKKEIWTERDKAKLVQSHYSKT